MYNVKDMAYAEKDFQTAFSNWLKIIYRATGAFELKISKTGTLPFDALKPHQEQALFHAKHNIVPYKLPDDTFSQKPFDCFCLNEVPAFVVIMFNAKSAHFYMIDIDTWLQNKQNSDRKSITEEVAIKIGQKYDLSGSLPFERQTIAIYSPRMPFVK